MSREQEYESLSPEGESRRDAILREVSAQLPVIAARRRRRKRAAVGGGALALVLAVSAAVVMVSNLRLAPPIAPPVVEAPTESADPLIDFAVVLTSDEIDPSLYVRTDLDAINSMVISDDELLRELAQMGRPAGLIKMNGEVRLSRDVVDELGPVPPGSF